MVSPQGQHHTVTAARGRASVTLRLELHARRYPPGFVPMRTTSPDGRDPRSAGGGREGSVSMGQVFAPIRGDPSSAAHDGVRKVSRYSQSVGLAQRGPSGAGGSQPGIERSLLLSNRADQLRRGVIKDPEGRGAVRSARS